MRSTILICAMILLRGSSRPKYLIDVSADTIFRWIITEVQTAPQLLKNTGDWGVFCTVVREFMELGLKENGRKKMTSNFRTMFYQNFLKPGKILSINRRCCENTIRSGDYSQDIFVTMFSERADLQLLMPAVKGLYSLANYRLTLFYCYPIPFLTSTWNQRSIFILYMKETSRIWTMFIRADLRNPSNSDHFFYICIVLFIQSNEFISAVSFQIR